MRDAALREIAGGAEQERDAGAEQQMQPQAFDLQHQRQAG